MSISELDLRLEMSALCASLFNRGFSVGSAGNVSVRLNDGILMTPTNSSLGGIKPDRIAKILNDGTHVSGDKPSKEIFLHQAFYESRPSAQAVVHLHSSAATALSCMQDINPQDCIPAITPYVVMRVGTVKLLPYVKPGDPRMGELVRDLKGSCAAVLLANHGPVVSGKDLASAVYAAEELEETAKLLLLLGDRKTRLLNDENIADLKRSFSLQ